MNPRALRPVRILSLLLPLVLALGLSGCGSDEPGTVRPVPSGKPSLLIAFETNRQPSPISGDDIYFYDVNAETPAYFPLNLNTTFDEALPAFSADGRWLAFNSTRLLTGTQATLFLYDTRAHTFKLLESPRTYTQTQNAALSGNGSRLAFHSQIGAGFFDLTVTLIDAVADTVIPVPSLHQASTGDFDPSLSGDGTLIACTTTRDGSFDIMLYSVPLDSVLDLPGLNTGFTETGASINATGRYVAFHSNRSGGVGLFDVYVYDRQTSSLLPMPGANTSLSEINPALSPDGRYVAYTSENDGAGDIRLYDLQAQKLITLPGLNDPYYVERYASVAVKP
jgi:Tol biopolymer transport system component